MKKKDIIENMGIWEDEYEEFEAAGLIPDETSEISKKKAKELLEKGPPYTELECEFLGLMDLEILCKLYPVEGARFMNM